MKRNADTLLTIAAIAALGLAGVTMTGCLENRAQSPEPAGTEQEIVAELEQVADEAREIAIADREQDLARRYETVQAMERALAEMEARVAGRTAELQAEQHADTPAEAEPVIPVRPRSNVDGRDIPEATIEIHPAPRSGEAAPEAREENGSIPVRPRRLPDPEPQPQVELVPVDLPAMTAVEVAFDDRVSSETGAVGDRVRAHVVSDVVGGDLVAIPAGSAVNGRVAGVAKQKKIGGRAFLLIEFDQIELPSGDVTPIRASVKVAGKKQGGKDAATIGGSAAGGAILGQVLGGDDRGRATAIGAVVGAAVGTAIAANNKGDPVEIEAGARFLVDLEEAVRVAVRVEHRGEVASLR